MIFSIICLSITIGCLFYILMLSKGTIKQTFKEMGKEIGINFDEPKNKTIFNNNFDQKKVKNELIIGRSFKMAREDKDGHSSKTYNNTNTNNSKKLVPLMVEKNLYREKSKVGEEYVTVAILADMDNINRMLRDLNKELIKYGFKRELSFLAKEGVKKVVFVDFYNTDKSDVDYLLYATGIYYYVGFGGDNSITTGDVLKAINGYPQIRGAYTISNSMDTLFTINTSINLVKNYKANGLIKTWDSRVKVIAIRCDVGLGFTETLRAINSKQFKRCLGDNYQIVLYNNCLPMCPDIILISDEIMNSLEILNAAMNKYSETTEIFTYIFNGKFFFSTESTKLIFTNTRGEQFETPFIRKYGINK